MRKAKIRLDQIETDPVGDMLCASESLKPYIDHYCALMTGGDTQQTLTAISLLPDDKRYLFRVVQCLDWALADFDDETVMLDMPYVAGLGDIREKLRLRGMQFMMLLKTLGE